MKHFIKITALILTALMILFLIAACGGGSQSGNGAGNQNNSGGNNAKTKKTKTEIRAGVSDGLPDKKYGGMVFNVLVTANNLINGTHEIAVEQSKGDVVGDAVYDRNGDVSNRFDIKFNYIKKASGGEFSSAVDSSAAAGDNSYDLILGTQKDLINSALNGSLSDINKIQNISIEKEWWGKDTNGTLAVNGKLYMASGDISLATWENMFVIYFNEDIIYGNSLKNPVELVNGDAWGFDRFIELSMAGGRNYSGYVSSTANHSEQYIVSLNMGVTKDGDDGFPALDFYKEKTKKVAGRLKELFASKNIIRNDALSNPGAKTFPTEFTGGGTLFMGAFLGDAVNVRAAAKNNVGIIPYPKYDEYQEKYFTTVLNSATMASFTKDVKDAEMSGIITEALCAGGYKTAVLAYYESALAKAAGRDDASEDMLDILRGGLRYNFGLSHSFLLNNIAEILEDVAGNFEETYKANEAEYKSSLASLISAYKAAAN